MTLAYSTNAFKNFSLSEAVEEIASLGFQGIEILCDRPHLYPPDFSLEQLRELKERLAAKELKVSNLNSFTLYAVGDMYLPSWIEEQEERRRIRIEHTRRCLEFSAFLGCGNISVPPGGPPGGLPRERALSLFQRGLEEVIPEAERLGVALLIEPEPGLLLENSPQFKEFIGRFSSPAVGLNFDVGHFFCAGEDPGAAFQELSPWIGHVHIEDIASSRRHHHLIPGRGAMDLFGFFIVLKKMEYRGDLSLELYTYDRMPRDAGREGREYLLPLLEKAGLNADEKGAWLPEKFS